MSEFDLTPKSYRDYQYIRILVKSFLIACFLILSTAVAANVLFKTRIQKADKILNDIQQRQNDIEYKKQYLENLKNIKNKLDSKLAAHKKISQSFSPTSILLALDESLINQIWFNEFSVKNFKDDTDLSSNTKATILGEASNHSIIAEFTGNLSAHELITETDIEKTLINNQSQQGLVEFIINLDINDDNAR